MSRRLNWRKQSAHATSCSKIPRKTSCWWYDRRPITCSNWDSEDSAIIVLCYSWDTIQMSIRKLLWNTETHDILTAWITGKRENLEVLISAGYLTRSPYLHKERNCFRHFLHFETKWRMNEFVFCIISVHTELWIVGLDGYRYNLINFPQNRRSTCLQPHFRGFWRHPKANGIRNFYMKHFGSGSGAAHIHPNELRLSFKPNGP